YRREGFFCPRRIAPPSRTLLSSSSNISAFIAKLLLDCVGELRHLLSRQIGRRTPGLLRPVIDDAGASALAPRTNCHANIKYAPAALDKSATARIRCQSRLKFYVLSRA